MFLFLVLMTIAILLTVFAVLAIGVGGTAFIIIFGDVIVCMLLIVYIIKRLLRKKK